MMKIRFYELFNLLNLVQTFRFLHPTKLKEHNYELYSPNPTNQVFCIIENSKLDELSQKFVMIFLKNMTKQKPLFALQQAGQQKKMMLIN